MAAVGRKRIGAFGVPSTILRASPTVTVTAPTGTVSTSQVTAEWAYTSPVDRTQKRYRVQLRQSDGSILFDSGILTGDDTEYTLVYPLASFVTYQMWVGVNDGITGNLTALTGPNWAFSSFFTELSAALPPPVNEKVGSVYEVAINGIGYMLADTPDDPIQRRTVQITPERLAVGDTPFAESFDRYNYIAHSDLSGGEGQLYLHRPRSDATRYSYSEWIDPFEPGEVRCVDTPVHYFAPDDAYDAPMLGTVAAGTVYVLTDGDELTALDTPTGTPIMFAPGAGGFEPVSLASDGTHWYATDGDDIYRNDTAATGTVWSTVDLDEIEWIGDRIAGLDNAAASPNFTTLDPAGAEEVGGGRFAFTGMTLRGLTGGDGHVWWGVNGVDTGRVQAWQLDSTDASFIALNLPGGEIVDNLYFYQGNVMLSTLKLNGNRKVYRCAASEGQLVPQLIAETDTVEVGDPVERVWFAGRDRFVAFSWNNMTRGDLSGIAVYDLESDGYARWQTGTEPGRVGAVLFWADEFAFAINSDGFYGRALMPMPHDGFLETSVTDFASNVVKVLSEITIATAPLNGSVEVSWSTNNNFTWFSAGIMSGNGSTHSQMTLEAIGGSIGLRLDLSANGAALSPVVKQVMGRTHPLGLADRLVVLPINCADRLTGMNGVELAPDSGPGKGWLRVRALESLIEQMVSVQNVDWPHTGEIARFQVVSVEATLVGVYDRAKGRRVDSGVAVVSLRRTAA